MNLGSPKQFSFKGDNIMKNTSLNCWPNSYCLYHSWKRPRGAAAESVLLIGWLNRGLLDSDRLDWLYSSRRSSDSELCERQGERERESKERKRAIEGDCTHCSISVWLLVPDNTDIELLQWTPCWATFFHLQEDASSNPVQLITDWTLE